MDRRLRAEHLEEARDDVDLDVELVAARGSSRASPRASAARTRRSRARRRAARRARGSSLEVPEHGELVEVVVPRRAGCSSTKPTRLTPYSGCCRSFRATCWPTSPGSDDDRVLDVRVGAPADGARGAAGERRRARSPPPRRASSFGTFGCATPVSQVTAKNIQAPTVTMLKTPNRSSTVEWSVRSSSRS